MSAYHCEGDEECVLFVKAQGNCGSQVGQLLERSVTFRAQQHIARAGFRRGGGDGSDHTVLSYQGGQAWPEIGVADVRESDIREL
jgi:hypothetical protein